MRMQKHNIDYVNTLQGSDSEFAFSHGNCWPLVTRPFGMTHWCPQTDEGAWQFTHHATRLQGIRATHSPMPWLSDYGHFTIMAEVGPLMVDAVKRACLYRKEASTFSPHYFRAFLQRYETTIEMTATERCAAFRFTFPKTEAAQVLVQPFPGASAIAIDPKTGEISGLTRAGSFSTPENFAGYFVAVPDRKPNDWGLTLENQLHARASELSGERVGAYLTFSTAEGEQVGVKIATSFISVEQARQNLAAEIGSRSFDEVQAESADAWEKELNRIEIEGASTEQRTTFYSCMYRAFLLPRKFYELSENGNKIHYSPYDGKVHDGEMYADNGFWDTFRTFYPFHALLAPSHTGDMMRGWTNALLEGEWTPIWPNPGHMDCMIGTHLDNIFADVYLRGITDFDVKSAYRILRKDAFEIAPPDSSYGRKGLEAFCTLGYVPADEMPQSAARTLDYAYNDWGLAQLARALGYEEEARLLTQRAFHYRNIFDPSVNWMRGRNRDGSWLEPFDEFAWSGPFVEGSVWQGGWAVQHDAAGLITLMGGQTATIEKLDRMLTQPPRYHIGDYPYETHEMSEMAAVDFGQYAHSNEPVFHVLFLYTYAGQPWKTQYWVRRVMTDLYNSGPAGFCGDEDNGAMSCWYLLNALGIYPFCPGHPSFVFGSPLFSRAIIHLENGNDLIIEAPDNNAQAVYVTRVLLNGTPLSRCWIEHQQLAQGGTLTFEMSPLPNTELLLSDDDLPYSLSKICQQSDRVQDA